MATNGDIRYYTTGDIAKYVGGQMSSAEMFAFEKAMDEDPFLAEAVEGYMAAPDTDIKTDLAALQEAITKQPPKVVPIKRKNQWLAAAAILLLLLGSGTTWFLFNPYAEKEIAQHKAEESIEQAPVAPEPAIQPQTQADSVQPRVSEEKLAPVSPAKTQAPVAKETENRIAAAETAAPPVADAGPPEPVVARGLGNLRKRVTDANGATADFSPANIFAGTVKDQSNHHPLPFVNVTIPEAGIDTYTDANGNFKIISGDSVVTAHIKSVGYVEQNIVMNARNKNHNIELEAQLVDLNAEVIVGYGTQKKSPFTGSVKTEKEKEATEDEPTAEPKDGWARYDFYLRNNNRLAASYIGTVDLSFIITPNGYKYDYKIENSTCHECNKEAIRLIKDGPAWKLTNRDKTSRVTISLQF